MVCKNGLAVIVVQPSKVEPHLKVEFMEWLTTRGDIWMWPRLIANA